MRGFRGLSGVGTREITKERLLRHGSVAISARGKIFQLPEVWPGPPVHVATPWLRLWICMQHKGLTKCVLNCYKD